VKYRVTILPRAEFDEAEFYEYLARHSATTAQRFVDKVNETLRRLCLHSTPGMPWTSENPKLAGLRWAKIRGFPKHLIFFRLGDERIEVVRILHGSRDIESLLEE
jgi:toxin ParE1/3/4